MTTCILILILKTYTPSVLEFSVVLEEMAKIVKIDVGAAKSRIWTLVPLVTAQLHTVINCCLGFTHALALPRVHCSRDCFTR